MTDAERAVLSRGAKNYRWRVAKFVAVGCSLPVLSIVALGLATSAREPVSASLLLAFIVFMAVATLVVRDGYLKTYYDQVDLNDGTVRIFHLEDDCRRVAKLEYDEEFDEISGAVVLAVTATERIVSFDGEIPVDAVPIWMPITSVASANQA